MTKIEELIENEFVCGEELWLDVQGKPTKLYYGILNPKVNGYILCVDEKGNPYNCYKELLRKNKLKLTSQMIADKFGVSIDGYEIINAEK